MASLTAERFAQESPTPRDTEQTRKKAVRNIRFAG